MATPPSGVADILGLPESTVQDMIANGEFGHTLMGETRLIPVEALEALFAEQPHPRPTPPQSIEDRNPEAREFLRVLARIVRRQASRPADGPLDTTGPIVDVARG